MNDWTDRTFPPFIRGVLCALPWLLLAGGVIRAEEAIVAPVVPSERAALFEVEDQDLGNLSEPADTSSKAPVVPIPAAETRLAPIRQTQFETESRQPPESMAPAPTRSDINPEQFANKLQFSGDERLSGDGAGGSGVTGATATTTPAPTPAPPTGDIASAGASPAADVVRAAEVPVVGSNDTGSLLQNSSDVQTVRNQQRSPVSFDPRIRGFHMGQIYTQADGVWWLPARVDLDTMLSKIDPRLLDSATVVPGPYGLRYGPGLAFLHIDTVSTPRYDTGFEVHARSGLSLRTNGGQVYGRETLYGGSDDWGFIFAYGNRRGNDYDAGNGLEVPASYRNVNYWTEMGFDLTEESILELRYGHLDQNDTQYAGQFFDLGHLGTNSFSATYAIDEDFQRLKVETWYNDTRFTGGTDLDYNRLRRHPIDPTIDTYDVITRVERALDDSLNEPRGTIYFNGLTSGRMEVSGVRAAATYGETDDIQLSVGTDLRYARQRLDENFRVLDPQPGAVDPTTGEVDESLLDDVIDPFATNQPDAALVDAGLFVEMELPFSEWWRTQVGARIDTAHTDVVESLRPGSTLIDPVDPNDAAEVARLESELDNHDTLYAFYMTHDIAFSQYSDLRLGFGHAQRAPTLTERYADGVFLGIIQNGFSRVIGDPDLNPERAWQIDAGFNIRYPRWRTRLSGYHAWVHDYITYEANAIASPEGARLLFARNTDLATLVGFEMYSEYDLIPQVMAFASLSYVEGRDETIGKALPGMYPLESRLGIRWTDDPENNRWGMEWGARIVRAEDRIGFYRVNGTNSTQFVAVEEPTPGFTVLYARCYVNATERMNLVAGIDNLGDRNYLEHLNLRLPADATLGVPATRVLSPGITPYFGIEWTY